MDFKTKFSKIVKKNNSLLCIGLDPEIEKIPNNFSIFKFNKSIIDATSNLVCAYKPNIAFYEAQGLSGLIQLKKTIEYLQTKYSDIPIVLDCKRGDVPNTARMYAKSIYEYWGVDATTVFPHIGLDSIEPYLDYKDKLTILLIKTSNPDSNMFQDLNVDGTPFYKKIAEEVSSWKKKDIGIFVGATYPEQLKEIRKIFPDAIFLSAGIGEQKAQTEKAVRAGLDKNGAGIMFNASRSIIYSQDPGKSAKNLRDEINKYR